MPDGRPYGAPPLLLDGGTATELQRGGHDVAAPWWSASILRTPAGRATLRQVHSDFIAAGADVITANTFRTSRYALALAGAGEREADELTSVALAEARAARAESGRAVTLAASVPPLADCFRPGEVPPDHVLRAEHRWHVESLARHGAELLLAETVNTSREAMAILEEGRRAGLPTWVSFVCTAGGRLLSGEPAGPAALAVAAAGAQAVLVNCTPLAGCEAALTAMSDARVPVPLGCYPNFENRSGISPGQHVNRYVEPAGTPGDFATALARLAAGAGLAIIGGCCGVSPEHLAAMTAAVTTRQAPMAEVAG